LENRRNGLFDCVTIYGRSFHYLTVARGLASAIGMYYYKSFVILLTKNILYFIGCLGYEPLSYPLFYQYGELGLGEVDSAYITYSIKTIETRSQKL
jgi:hypothetical protein